MFQYCEEHPWAQRLLDAEHASRLSIIRDLLQSGGGPSSSYWALEDLIEFWQFEDQHVLENQTEAAPQDARDDRDLGQDQTVQRRRSLPGAIAMPAPCTPEACLNASQSSQVGSSCSTASVSASSATQGDVTSRLTAAQECMIAQRRAIALAKKKAQQERSSVCSGLAGTPNR